MFTSWVEVGFAALMLLPLLFFAACALYLLRLTLNAAAERGRVVVLPRPELIADAAKPIEGDPKGDIKASPALPALSVASFSQVGASDSSADAVNGLSTISLEKEDSTLPHKSSGSIASARTLGEASQTGTFFVPRTAGLENGTRFTLLIPAHDEELLLGTALNALQQLQYPRALYEIVVIADNCSDHTAAIARQSGVLALERFDKARIGKGYALEDTLAWLLSEKSSQNASEKPLENSSEKLPQKSPEKSSQRLSENREDMGDANGFGQGATTLLAGPSDTDTDAAWSRARRFDAVVVLDADTFVSSNLLAVFANALQNGQNIVQARYDVLNTDDSWRTRLMSCALALAHVVKPLGRERLRLSDGLKGNGMCFAREVVLRVPWSGESITEDIEYTLRVCAAGYRVAFVPEACVWAQMPTTGAQAASQRQRWEGGRYRLLFQVAPRLLADSARTRNRLLRDRAIELIVPPFAEMFALPALCGGLCALLFWLCGWRAAGVLTSAWALVLLLQAVYLFGGMWVARVPSNVVFSLLSAPLYIIWKLGLYVVMAAGRSTGGWKRTERHELSSK